MMKDDLGQASLDFLAGIIIFMGSLVMVMQFIPGIFTPFQTEATDLNSVAYRTGVLLLEDPGWWSTTNGSITNKSGTDWENHLKDPNSTLRVGLASVDAANKTIPNVLNNKKLEKFANISIDNLTEFLGLYRNISGNKMKYVYNISIWELGGEALSINGTNIMVGDPFPVAAQDIAKVERLVAVASEVILADGNLSGNSATSTVQINYTHLEDQDFRLRLTGFNMTGSPARLNSLSSGQLNPSGQQKGSYGLIIKLNGTTMVSTTVNSNDPVPNIKFYNSEDKFDITIPKNRLTIGQTYIFDIKFDNIIVLNGLMSASSLPRVNDYYKLVVEVWQ